MSDTDKPRTPNGEGDPAKRVLDLAFKVGGSLLTAAGLAGLVAFTGGAVTWVRFQAAGLPADQALDAVPRDELVVIGAASLSLALVAAVLALALVYAVDHGGRPTDGMQRGLVLLTFLEVAVTLGLAWKTDAGYFVAAALVTAGTLGVLVAYLPSRWVRQRVPVDRLTDRLTERETVPLSPRERATASTAFERYMDTAVQAERDAEALGGAERDVLLASAAALRRRAYEIHEAGPAPPAKRRKLTFAGAVGQLALVAVVTGALYCLTVWWAAAAVLLACVLATLCFGVSVTTGTRFWPYGLAVFFSVPIFAGVLNAMRTYAEPQVEPAALVRSKDGVKEGLQGLYVAETSDRVYLASVATRCGSKRPLGGTARMMWVPKKEVVSLAIGPLQDLDDAGRRAPEMLEHLISVRIPPPPVASPGKGGAKPRARTPRAPTVAPAIRLLPGLRRLAPARAAPGQRVVATGKGFGTERGAVKVGGRPARILSWTNRRIAFQAPSTARGGKVVVACADGQPAPTLAVRDRT